MPTCFLLYREHYLFIREKLSSCFILGISGVDNLFGIMGDEVKEEIDIKAHRPALQQVCRAGVRHRKE